MKAATTIEKVCHVLKAFHGCPSLGLTQVAELTGLLNSDVHRILKSLQQFGFIEQDGERGRYRLGLELLELGYLVHHRLRLSDVARPVLRELAEKAGGVANLATLDLIDTKIVFIEQIGSLSEGQTPWRIGQRVDFPHTTAVGKTLLAHLDPEMIGIVIGSKGLQRRTRRTITNEADLERELRCVRERGFATDCEEALEGASCIGAPVRDYTRRVVAAVSVSMEADRLVSVGERKVAALVMSAAAKISAVLGGTSRSVPVSANAARVRSRVPARTMPESQESKGREPSVTA
ncbi:MAG: IclR family transcriptional regulator [Bryobacteraceae bacterium]|jgi:DNA-binding IclR family transcriptional regulator